MKISASLEAQARGCGLTVSAVDPELAVDADRDLLFAAVGNLLQNAFKFTEQDTEVSLNAYAAGRSHPDRRRGQLRRPAAGRRGKDVPARSRRAATDNPAWASGLSICRRSVEANGGVLSVRDMPGPGCVFTIELPRHRSRGPRPPQRANDICMLYPSDIWSCSGCSG